MVPVSLPCTDVISGIQYTLSGRVQCHALIKSGILPIIQITGNFYTEALALTEYLYSLPFLTTYSQALAGGNAKNSCPGEGTICIRSAHLCIIGGI